MKSSIRSLYSVPLSQLPPSRSLRTRPPGAQGKSYQKRHGHIKRRLQPGTHTVSKRRPTVSSLLHSLHSNFNLPHATDGKAYLRKRLSDPLRSSFGSLSSSSSEYLWPLCGYRIFSSCRTALLTYFPIVHRISQLWHHVPDANVHPVDLPKHLRRVRRHRRAALFCARCRPVRCLADQRPSPRPDLQALQGQEWRTRKAGVQAS